MTGKQRGFLLLTSHLGNPKRKPLTAYQLRTLTDRVRWGENPQADRDLTVKDLIALGYGRAASEHILSLLGDEAQLDVYLNRGNRMGCTPITRAEETYPILLRRRLGLDSPGCLWAKGNLGLLNTPAIALVGSRDLSAPNRAFAEAVGREAARQGLTLVSGNARGADRAGQDACLTAGGNVISVVADALSSKQPGENLLFVSEEDYDAPFTAQRALSRNRVIHCLGRLVFVAQATLNQGGTWDGTVKNLNAQWSQIAVFDDGSGAAQELEAMGAYLVGLEDLTNLGSLCAEKSLW